MNRTKLIKRVRSLTRDITNSIFTEDDVIDYLNEGVDRIKQVFPELSSMTYLETAESEPQHIPSQYHGLLSLFACARCFTQDERHYQSTQSMNEFETKLDEFKQKVDNGEVVLTGITLVLNEDYVVDNYFNVSAPVDLDEGVEGV